MADEMQPRLSTFSFAGLCLAVLIAGSVLVWQSTLPPTHPTPPDRLEVVFWHFWGGEDRQVVEQVVEDFNASQSRYWVRAVAVPGNNLDAKLFLTVAGGNPPDLVNQDDPVIADWYERGAILSVDDFAGQAGRLKLEQFLLPSAAKLGTVNGQLVGVPNGLDIRGLYYNQTVLDEFALAPPRTIEQFDEAIAKITPPGSDLSRSKYVAFLSDPRRLWSWGYVFGGEFIARDRQQVTLTNPRVVAALDWMRQFTQWYGTDAIIKFRQADQSLPGKSFPLLPPDDVQSAGRYIFVMDGQWRVRDIRRFQDRRRQLGKPPLEFGVCPLPYPPGGRANSGWVNGNVFLVPRGAKNAAGAWAFVQYWIGLQDRKIAAEICARGGWLPVAESVLSAPEFVQYVATHPPFGKFVEMAQSDQMFPYPLVPGAMFFRRTVDAATDWAIHHPADSTEQILDQSQRLIQNHLDQLSRQSEDER